MLFQTTNSLDIVNIPCFEINIKQNSVYGQFQHEFIQYWFALIIHPDRRHSAQCACLRGILISINTNLDMSTAFKPGHKATKQIKQNMHGLSVLGCNVVISYLHCVHLCDYVCIVIPAFFGLNFA